MQALTVFCLASLFTAALTLLVCVRGRRAEAKQVSEPPAGDGAPRGSARPPKEALWPFIALGAWIVFAVVRGLYISGQPADPRVVPPSIAGLDSSVKDFASINGLHTNLSTDVLSGKVIIIDKAGLTLHPLTRGLPRSRVAHSPDEVSVVVWVEASRTKTFDLGWYTGEAADLGQAFRAYLGTKPSSTIPAYQAKWNVKIIDLTTKEVRYQKSFTGAEPPGTRVEFRSKSEKDQAVVYDDGHRVDGAAILTNDDGAVVGLVGAVPWDETLAWVKNALGIGSR